MAKLGLLMLRNGRWDDRQLVPAEWTEDLVTSRVLVDDDEDYGLGWWLSRGDPSLFEANGRGGQRITVVRELSLVVVMTGGGFEPGDIGGFILRALRSNGALPEDDPGKERLAESLRFIAEPSPPRAVRESEIGDRISGRIYDLDDNTLGVRSCSVEFADEAIALLRMRLVNGDEVVQSLGLDGRYRLTESAEGATSAGRGEWLDDGRFNIEFNRLSLINRYEFKVEFRESSLEIEAFEPTELGTAILRGTWRQ